MLNATSPTHPHSWHTSTVFNHGAVGALLVIELHLALAQACRLRCPYFFSFLKGSSLFSPPSDSGLGSPSKKKKEKEKKTLSVILIQQSQSQCNQWEYAINEQSLQSIARCVLIHLVHRLLILPLTPPPPTMSFHSSTVLFC